MLQKAELKVFLFFCTTCSVSLKVGTEDKCKAIPYYILKYYKLVHVYLALLIRYGDLYTAKNVAISGTHTHSGPGGYLQYVLYLVTSLGFVRQSFEALANGIELAIVEAHENLRPGSIFLNGGTKFKLR